MMNILFNWNSSVTNAPAGYDVAGFEADIEAAGAQIDQLLSSTNITLSVTVGLGEIGGMPMPAGDGGDGGAFPNIGAWMSYADTIQELKTHTTNQANLDQLAFLPATPSPDLSQLYISDAQLKLWGKMDPNSVEVDR